MVQLSRDLETCVVRWPHGPIGLFRRRSLDYSDMPAVRSIVRGAGKDDYRFESIVLGIISSDAFRKREAPDLKQASLR